ncbi:interleukin-5 receptor subunit alpha [Erinaceus europaeus]|uniref:Interleukin-5 receptor subunit alpha n=1 Tax=Erinaceus europaeus TaxID=9365 RepID=A0ABM3WJY4_ERIEU|nr:interleukin-5 receptor subunit alpha [Erinaceus europaeus]
MDTDPQYRDYNYEILPPVNFTITAAGLAQVLLRWEPNPDQEQGGAQLGYHVKIDSPQEADYETRSTWSRRTAELHRGLRASVRTISWAGPTLPASAWVTTSLEAPPGLLGSAAVNLTCNTNTSAPQPGHLWAHSVSLHCSWHSGPDAPQDTQYFLSYRYGARKEECPEYHRDTQGRNVACWFPTTAIRGKGLEPLAVQVTGNSEVAAIRTLDRLFSLPAIDCVNPPVNVTAEVQGPRVSIQWEKPVSFFPARCFRYEVRLCNKRSGSLQTETTDSTSFVSFIASPAVSSVRVRAALSPACRAEGAWGAWSSPIHVGSEVQTPSWDWLPITLTVAGCGGLLATSLICRLCHLWTKLCPPVPAPKSSMKEFLVALNYEKPGPSTVEPEVVTQVEEPGLDVPGDTRL